jgi:CDP-diacylglycerol---glycerol-3-phosphate 3-phosphatidyltransferase
VKLLGALEKPFYAAVDPLVARLIRAGVRPNTITTIGTGLVLVSALAFGLGHIRIGGLLLLLSGVTDTLDGQVARGGAMVTKFGAFYDSTLDRVSDGAVLGGLVYFYAFSPRYSSQVMLVVTLLGLVGAYMTSYTRARAEALGVDAKVGVLQRPERVTLLSAPQAFFGLALGGWVLAAIIVLLTVTAWITVVQRFIVVHAATRPTGSSPAQAPREETIPPSAATASTPPAPPALSRQVTS